jgi:starch phosphorylase
MADIEGGMFGDKEYFKPLVDSISNMKVGNDWFLVANDFASYLEAQEEVDRVSTQFYLQQHGDVCVVSQGGGQGEHASSKMSVTNSTNRCNPNICCK